MCGMAGLAIFELRKLDPAPVVQRMQAKVVHRGPDDTGMFVSADQHCALTHTRLSILDLSPAGPQPMSSTDGRYSITYNGEIYNYKELRKELGVRGEATEDRGQKSDVRDQIAEIGKRDNATDATNATRRNANTWNSNSDTEVILRAYERWGIDCLQKLRGMFAFAIWDEERQELFLARDPLGIKPLYYYQSEEWFLFASELRALLASELVPRQLSRDGLASYLQYGSVQDPLTILDNVYSLLPGHGVVVKHSGNHLEIEHFAFGSTTKTQDLTPNTTPKSRPEAVKLVRSKLEDSIRAHLVSDVPLGAFLSGGIDSSAIVVLMSRVADQRPKTFSVVFKESQYSEAEHAKVIAQKFGTEHREILLSEESLLAQLPNALEAMDQPTMD